MIISSAVGLIIVAVLFIILVAIVWELISGNALPQLGRKIPCGPNRSCPSGFHCSGGICLTQGECNTNNDCPKGDLCNNGRCQECRNDNHCPVGSTCQNGRCSVMICQGDQDCPNGFFCDVQEDITFNICRPVTCQNNADCFDNQTCINGACVTMGNVCTTDRECRRGALRCLNHRCQQCQKNEDCPSGSCLIKPLDTGKSNDKQTNNTTINTIGICVTGCHPSCPSGQRCFDGECVANDSVCGNQCTTSQDCSKGCPFCREGVCHYRGRENGDYCTTNQDCVSGNCQNGRCYEQGTECLIGGDQTCPVDSPYCVNGKCRTSPEGLICVPPTQKFGPGQTNRIQVCPEGFHCVNGRCRKHPGRPGDRCEDTQDCMKGLYCEEKIRSGRYEKRCRRRQ